MTNSISKRSSFWVVGLLTMAVAGCSTAEFAGTSKRATPVEQPASSELNNPPNTETESPETPVVSEPEANEEEQAPENEQVLSEEVVFEDTPPEESPDPIAPVTPVQPETTAEPEVPVAPIAPVEPQPICVDETTRIGAYVSFIVDNSRSNLTTDCPSRVSGQSSCPAPTARETTILRTFDQLSTLADSDGSSLAQSEVSVSFFPGPQSTASQPLSGVDRWVEVAGGQRSAVGEAAALSRIPDGQTPYVIGLQRAKALFEQLPVIDVTRLGDFKQRLAIIVSDGFATDYNPTEAVSLANDLKSLGVRVVTVVVGNPLFKEAGLADTMASITREHNRRLSAGQGPYYEDNGVFANLDAFFDFMYGRSGESSLVERISDVVINIDNFDLLEAQVSQVVTSVTEERCSTPGAGS